MPKKQGKPDVAKIQAKIAEAKAAAEKAAAEKRGAVAVAEKQLKQITDDAMADGHIDEDEQRQIDEAMRKVESLRAEPTSSETVDAAEESGDEVEPQESPSSALEAKAKAEAEAKAAAEKAAAEKAAAAGDASFFLASASALADKEGKAASERAAADAKAVEGNAAVQKAAADAKAVEGNAAVQRVAPVKAKVEEAVKGEKAKVEEAMNGDTGSIIRKETTKAVRSARQEPTQASPEPPLASQQMSSGSGAADPHLAAQQQKLLDKEKSKALRAEPRSEGTVKAAAELPTKAVAEPAAAPPNNAAPSNGSGCSAPSNAKSTPSEKLEPVDLRAQYENFLKISVLLVGVCVLAFCFSPNEGCVYTRCTADVSYVGPSASLLSLGGMFGSESEHVQLLGTFNSLRECEDACVVMKGRAKRAFWGASVVKKAKCVAFTYAAVSTTSAAFNGHCYATVSYGNETGISSEPFLRPEYTGASNAVVSGLVTSLTPLSVLFRGAPQDTSANTDL